MGIFGGEKFWQAVQVKAIEKAIGEGKFGEIVIVSAHAKYIFVVSVKYW